MPTRVVLPVEPTHRPMECDIVTKAAMTLAYRRAAFDMEERHRTVVPDAPAVLAEPVAPVEVVHVEPVAEIEQADLVHGRLADEHPGPIDRIHWSGVVFVQLRRLVAG